MPSNSNEYMKNYWKTHPEQYKKQKERIKKWQKEHPEKIKDWQKKSRKIFYQKHPEKKRVRNQKTKDYYRKLRKKLILALGNKCQICGYSKCIEALEIHHLDSNDKDGITSMGHLNKIILEKTIQLWKEDKVLLLCANCHREEETKFRNP